MCFSRNTSKSTTSSTTTSTTNQFDERIAATDDAIVLRLDDGASIDIEVADQGALQAAEKAFEVFEAIFADTLSFVADQSGQSIGLVKETLERSRSETAQGLSELLKVGTVIAVVAIAAATAPKLLGK